jgi:hypothetical protein
MAGTVVNVGSLPENVQKHSNTANAHAEGAGNICKDMLEKVFAPVAGPMAMYIFYILLLLGVFVVFLVLGGISAVRMASETVTEVKQTLQTSIPYPDIYICIPASERYNLFVYEDVIKKKYRLEFYGWWVCTPKERSRHRHNSRAHAVRWLVCPYSVHHGSTRCHGMHDRPLRQ